MALSLTSFLFILTAHDREVFSLGHWICMRLTSLSDIIKPTHSLLCLSLFLATTLRLHMKSSDLRTEPWCLTQQLLPPHCCSVHAAGRDQRAVDTVWTDLLRPPCLSDIQFVLRQSRIYCAIVISVRWKQTVVGENTAVNSLHDNTWGPNRGLSWSVFMCQVLRHPKSLYSWK